MKLRQITLAISLLGFFISCRSTDDGAGSTNSGNNPSTSAQAVTYDQNIKPLIATCVSCHGPGGTANPRPFNNYDQVKAAYETIKNATDNNSMPLGSPWTTTQKALFLQWKTDGLKQ